MVDDFDVARDGQNHAELIQDCIALERREQRGESAHVISDGLHRHRQGVLGGPVDGVQVVRLENIDGLVDLSAGDIRIERREIDANLLLDLGQVPGDDRAEHRLGRARLLGQLLVLDFASRSQGLLVAVPPNSRVLDGAPFLEPAGARLQELVDLRPQPGIALCQLPQRGRMGIELFLGRLDEIHRALHIAGLEFHALFLHGLVVQTGAPAALHQRRQDAGQLVVRVDLQALPCRPRRRCRRFRFRQLLRLLPGEVERADAFVADSLGELQQLLRLEVVLIRFQKSKRVLLRRLQRRRPGRKLPAATPVAVAAVVSVGRPARGLGLALAQGVPLVAEPHRQRVDVATKVSLGLLKVALLFVDEPLEHLCHRRRAARPDLQVAGHLALPKAGELRVDAGQPKLEH